MDKRNLTFENRNLRARNWRLRASPARILGRTPAMLRLRTARRLQIAGYRRGRSAGAKPAPAKAGCTPLHEHSPSAAAKTSLRSIAALCRNLIRANCSGTRRERLPGARRGGSVNSNANGELCFSMRLRACHPRFRSAIARVLQEQSDLSAQQIGSWISG